MRLPTRQLNPEEFSERLRRGDRRQGLVLYRPSCQSCQACQAIRIDPSHFKMNRSQRRTLRNGDKNLQIKIAPPKVNQERVNLYNLHKSGRGLTGDADMIEEDGYRAFLVDTCTQSFEMQYFLNERLVGVAIVDQADDALSAVYTYFDPELSHMSLGVYSILKQIEMCRERKLPWLYLGLYVQGCKNMEYKANYFPHERNIAGVWQRFDHPKATIKQGF